MLKLKSRCEGTVRCADPLRFCSRVSIRRCQVCDVLTPFLCWPLTKSVSRKRSFAVVSWCRRRKKKKVLPMSLVEDVLDVLHMVLEYFGVPPDMLVPVWDSQLCGQYRSIVRMVGTNLPLTPAARVHFQIPLLTHRPHGYVDVTVDAPAIPSLADVLWVFEDEGDSCAKTRNHLPPKKQSTVNRDVARHPGPAPTRAQRGGRAVRPATEPDALKKITALESELLKLRAQIAMIVTAAPASGLRESQNTPGTPLMSPPPRPALTSTPRCAAPPPPPPPPPPLPPPCPGVSTDTLSVAELIRQRRKHEKDANGQLKSEGSGLTSGSEAKGIPSMLDVLKDLNQVKLRSVDRSLPTPDAVRDTATCCPDNSVPLNLRGQT
ncbi:hypothetical protein F2P81_024092 [Scophthalmus maximus]|uniref:Mitochondrial fission regulator n=1 Tax=Scophthalmus maximus TaxID=52904 RepID=A0A6A4RWH9_SCOMX|nr:hypothetical protein F2P81_024092 [Scophthalmus maximus]